MAEAVQVDLSEVGTLELINELKSRSTSSVIVLSMIGEGGKTDTNFYRDGDIIHQLRQVMAVRQGILSDLEIGDLKDED